MGRWEPGASGRLQQAALDLFGEHGYDATTVAQIAARAGVTERTFFRHHADKREVLFTGSAELEDLLVRSIESTPVGVPPLMSLSRSLELVGDFLGDRRAFVLARHRAITASSELHERELAKLAQLSAALAQALRNRGASEVVATLLGEVGVAVFRTAFERWVTEDVRPFDALIRDSLNELKCAVLEVAPPRGR